MSETNQKSGFTFDLPKNQSSEIKVIGVGGGGSNAVNYMFHQGIKGVDFVVCNTDAQALTDSPVPNKVQLGITLTEGLGAGANPEIGERAAVESMEDVKELLSSGTKMVFITAGMGGGTGTGAAPIIAKTAREMGILSVGIVTMPFGFEGTARKRSAEAGVDSLREHVDSLIVINNDKLRDVYGNLGFKAGFAKANEVLNTAARGIAEVITQHYRMNIDLNDAKTVLANSGTAIMGSAIADGENRAEEAIRKALDSPLLNDNHIVGAKNVLLLIVSGNDEITFDEIGSINDFVQAEAGGSANIIMGVGEDEELNENISVTIIATGFDISKQVNIVPVPPKKIVHDLGDDSKQNAHPVQTEKKKEEPKQTPPPVEKTPQESELINPRPSSPEPRENPEPSREREQVSLSFDLRNENPAPREEPKTTNPPQETQNPSGEKKVVFNLHDPEEDVDSSLEAEQNNFKKESELVRGNANQTPHQNPQPKPEPKAQASPQVERINLSDSEVDEKNLPQANLDPDVEAQMKRMRDRQARLKAFNYRAKNLRAGGTNMENEPAYKRMGVELDHVKHSKDNSISRYTLGDDEQDGFRSNNSFLHDNVD